MKKVKHEQGWRKKTFKQAMDKELREHKKLLYCILHSADSGDRNAGAPDFPLHNYEGAFFCVLTIALLYVPSWVQVRLRIELPPPLEITILCFIFAAEILGEVNAFYVRVPNWDTMLHTINGFLAAAVGFSMVLLLNDNDKLTFDLSPFFLAMVAFCFSMTIGVLWEFFRVWDGLVFPFGYAAGHGGKRHLLRQSGSHPQQQGRGGTGIYDVVINGESLGMGGYLDIGLIDTMKDLLVNFVGAVVFSVTGFFLCPQ